MTATDRIPLATQHADVVVSADGLLSDFNDAGVLGPLDVLAASTIARITGETDQSVVLAAAFAVRGTRFGHVCITPDDLRESVVVEGGDPAAIDSLPWPDPSAWMAALGSSAIVGDGNGDHPLVLEAGLLYLQRYHRYEAQVAEIIAERCAHPPTEIAPASTAMLTQLLGTAESASRQRQAAELALTDRVTVIVGGPGTGKTHTVGSVLAALAAAESFPLVAVCAPTGKAAARMGEAILEQAEGIENAIVRERLSSVVPSTIHRLLGWSWGRSQFRHGASQRLPHDLVIVDEMSMVSLPLAAKLLSAVRDDAAIVLVGDPFQLESIEAGTVLADLVGPVADDSTDQPVDGPAIGRHITVLDHVHRFAADSAIADFAGAVRGGHVDQALELLGSGDENLRWVPNRDNPAFAEMWSALVDQRRRMVELARQSTEHGSALVALTEMAVLSAHRRGPESVREWGRDLETSLDDRFTGLRWEGEWYPGRPIMITRNDYGHDLYNGDIGLTVETDDGLRVAFDRGGVRTYPLTQLGDHATVHAMTIHKSQGSQFDEVVVVLPGEASRLLTRELLYTAVTRARTRVWVVGGEEPVRAAIERSVQRASGLATRLWGSLE